MKLKLTRFPRVVVLFLIEVGVGSRGARERGSRDVMQERVSRNDTRTPGL